METEGWVGTECGEELVRLRFLFCFDILYAGVFAVVHVVLILQFQFKSSLQQIQYLLSRVLRCFTLYGGILCYHEEPDIESVSDPSKPRARLNLAKTETIAEMHSKDKPGLPSADLLTINIYDPIIHAKRKWEMCCTSKEQQVREKERKKEVHMSCVCLGF